MIYGLVVVGLLGVIALWFITTQRSLVSLDEMNRNALSQIGVQLSSRWDAISALVDLIKGYSEHEYRSLVDIVEKRQKVGDNSSVSDINQQENTFTQTLSHIMAIGEAYPELKAHTLYINTMDSVNQYENQVRMSRMVFNDTVTKLNRSIRQFPTSLIASQLGFSQKDYLETPSNKADMPSMR